MADLIGAVPVGSLFNQASADYSPPLAATQLRIEEISMREGCQLNKLWHSMLPRTDLGNMLCGNTSAAYAAEFEGRYYAIALFSQPIIRAIARDGKTIELRRLAICHEAPKNTASRMLAICLRLVKKRYPQMEKVVSYLAVDNHKGTIYRAAGWQPVGKVSAARPQRKRGDHGRATGPLQTHSPKQRWEIGL